jgi:hypothetical protein
MWRWKSTVGSLPPAAFLRDSLEMLGVKPQLGRFFVAEEGQAAGKAE